LHHTVDAMTQFLAEARRHPLLTAAEEIELAERIERGDLEAKGEADLQQPATRCVDCRALPVADLPRTRATVASPLVKLSTVPLKVADPAERALLEPQR
jgi:hypothetical protein